MNELLARIETLETLFMCYMNVTLSAEQKKRFAELAKERGISTTDPNVTVDNG